MNTVITKPLTAQFVTNHSIIVAEEHSAYLFDTKKNKITSLKNDDTIFHIATNKRNGLCTVSSAREIALYDAHTGAKLWWNNSIGQQSSAVIFNPTDDSILAALVMPENAIHIYDYKNNHVEKYRLNEVINNNDLKMIDITYHPIKEIIIFTQYNERWNHTNIKHLNKKDQYQPSNRHVYNWFMSKPRYNSQNTHMVRLKSGNNNNNDSYKYRRCMLKTIETKKKETAYFPSLAAAFHPNGLLAFINDNHSINYYDITSETTILTVPLNISHLINKNIDFDFSPNGKKMVVVLKDRCIIEPVPFNAFYKADTREKLFPLWWLLQCYLHENNYPHDLMKVLIKKLLKMYRR